MEELLLAPVRLRRTFAHGATPACDRLAANGALSRTSQLDLKKLKHDYGIGARFHGPFATLLRLELARSNETGLAMIFAASPVF